MEEQNKATTEVATSEPKKEVAMSNMETDYSLGIFGSSNNFKMAWQMAQALASSSIVPQTFQQNPSNCLIAIEQAQRLDTSPMLVMQNLHVIQGRPSWSASFLIACINNSGKFDMELQFDEEQKDDKPFSCVAWTMKNGRRIEGMKVDMDMANSEGWTTKNGSKWKTMPQLMLRYRSASFFARLNCPEIALGFYSKEEVEDNDFYASEMDKEDFFGAVKENAEAKANQIPFEEAITSTATEVENG